MVKHDKDGNFQKCKARWILRGFQGKQKWDQQTDSPTTTRPGFLLICQKVADELCSVHHIDLKTAFLQGEEYDHQREVVCQLPPEAGYKPWIAARLKKPAYALKDAPRRWWNKIDTALRSYGMKPTRADRCTYVLYSEPLLRPGKTTFAKGVSQNTPTDKHLVPDFEAALEYLLDPVTGSAAKK